MSDKTTLREFINSLERLSDNGKNDGLPVMVKKYAECCYNLVDFDIETVYMDDGESYVEGVITGDEPTIKAVTIE